MSFLKRLLKTKFDSGDFWRRRYEKSQTSGPGSYGRLAAYKADVVNGMVRDLNIASVIEFGSGDGNQAALFEIPKYTGIDISPLVVDKARKIFVDRADWTFETSDKAQITPNAYDMSMSLDVIYHLVEDEVFEPYMRDLVAAARRYVLIYASDHNEVAKDAHVHHRHYSDWLARHFPDLKLIETLEQPYPAGPDTDAKETSFAHFKIFEKP